MQILIALTLQFWSASHSIIMGYQNKQSEGHKKLIYFNISFCKHIGQTRMFIDSIYDIKPILPGFFFHIRRSLHTAFLWDCVSGFVSQLWDCCGLFFDRTLQKYLPMCGLSQCICLLSLHKKRDFFCLFIFIYEYKVLRQGSQAFWAFVNQIASADFLFMTSTWLNSEPNTSPRIYRYFMFIIQTVVFSLFFSYFA